MVNFDNFGGLTSVLEFHIFLILTVKICYAFMPSAKVSDVKNCYSIFTNVKNCYQFFTPAKNWYSLFTNVKNQYQMLTDVKNWYLIFTDVNDRICNI